MSGTLTLNNGVEMPALGFGVYQTPPDETADAVEAALRVGYRHVDTAAAYHNERGVGEAIRRSGLDREDVFVETKVWISDYGYDETLHAFDKSARKLGVDQIDLLLLHMSVPSDFDRTIAAYRALETLLAEGKVRAIGVSNFMPGHLAQLLDTATVVPAVNQSEVHPYFRQPDVLGADAAYGILTQAWSPLGGVTFYPRNWPGSDAGPSRSGGTMHDPTLAAIGGAHGKTPAQVMLRWHVQEGRAAIPKSTNPIRIAENFDIFNFKLTDADIARINALDTGVRSGPDPEAVTQETWGRAKVPEP